MKKIVKKVVAMMMAGGMLLSMSGSDVFAKGNYTDALFTCFAVPSTTKYISPREKLDATSATVKLTQAVTPVTVRVYGSSLDTGTAYNCTYGTPKVVGVSDKYTYLPNLVKERNYRYARLGFSHSGSSNVILIGWWSPDSI